MDGYQLTAVIFQSIAAFAWPIAFIIVAAMFKGKLADLLPKLRLKRGDWEASFRLEKAEEEVAALPPAPQGPPPSPEERDRFDELVRLSPRGALLDARAELEEAVEKFAEVNGLAAWTRKGAPIQELVRGLRDGGVIDKHISAILDDLRAIGNRAAHTRAIPVSAEEARRFKKLSDDVIQRLRLPDDAEAS